MQKAAKCLMVPLLLVAFATAGETNGPGTTGASFLKIEIGARAAAMGGAFTALADDATALYWNPAGLAQLKKAEFSATYNSWFQEISQGYLSLTFPSPGGTFALGVNYVDMGKMKGYDISEGGDPVSTGDFGVSDIQASLGYAFGDKLMFGISGGMLQDTIKDSTETAFLGTIGILFKPNSNFSLGISYQNLGSKLGESPLPAALRGGLAVKLGNLTLSLDVVSPNDNDSYFCGGVEFSLGSLIELRGGYTSNQDIGEGYTAGIGFNTSTLSVDYACVTYGDLGNTHRVSLGMKW